MARGALRTLAPQPPDGIWLWQLWRVKLCARLRRDRLMAFGYGNYGTWSFAPDCTATAAGPADALTGRQPVLTAHIRISIMRLNPIAN